jgi:transaldolase
MCELLSIEPGERVLVTGPGAIGLIALQVARAAGRDEAVRSAIEALRGTYHVSGLAGGSLVMSIHPAWQANLLASPVAREERIDEPVAADILARLERVDEFRRAYEPDGLSEHEMVSCGPTQRTLSQFVESGWKQLEWFTAEAAAGRRLST